MGRAEDLFQSLIDVGESMIRQLVEQRASEELFLDFKRAATQAQHTRLQLDDRENHAKSLSGFGNTAGGVIVWGVDCRNLRDSGDVARALHPIPFVDRFRSWLEADVSGATLPSHVGVRHGVCHRDANGAGYVATLVPAADHGPLQVPTQWRYYMRAGSSFTAIPHAMLAAMFGRRPTPQFAVNVSVAYPLNLQGERAGTAAHITVRNDGLGIARDLFLSVRVVTSPDSDCVRIMPAGDDRIQEMFGPHGSRTVMCHPHAAFPPGSEVRMAEIVLSLPKVIPRACTDLTSQEGIGIEIAVGCGNGPTSHLRISQLQSRLQHSIQLLDASNADGMWLAKRVFGLVED